MKKISVVFYAAFISVCMGQTIPDSMLYLGQTPPVYEPKKFILPYSSGCFVAEKIAVSADNKEIYYSELNGYPSSSSKIIKFKYSNDTWNGPFDLIQNYTNPIYSTGGDTLFIEDGQAQAWYLVKKDTSWGSPSRFWNSPHPQHNLQMVRTGKYYLTSDPVISANGDISELVIQNSDTTIYNLGYPLNSTNNGMDFFIDNDDSYIIRVIKSNGLGDLYISYHNADGSWTNPKNLGTQVNSAQGWEWGPYVTNENKYLFFTRQEGSIDIYWVRVDNLIDSLRHTNFIPYVKNSIPDQQAIKGLSFTCQIPDSTFLDDDGNKTLTYSATLINGNPLPAWLSFDSTTCNFFASSSPFGIYNIKVVATDTANASVSATLKIIVALPNIDYFGQVPPGDSAKIFTPGAVSQLDRPEHAGVFSRDGKEFYFCVSTMNWNIFNTYVRKFINGSWTTETLASFSSISGGAAEVFINKQNTRIIFVSKGTGFTSDGWIKTDFWTAERNGDSLGNPVKLGSAINDIEVQWHPSVSDSGHIYFGSKGSVYTADCINDTTFSLPVRFSDPSINFTGSNNAEVYIAPDESYLVFSSNRPGGYGSNDLYISYKKKDNTWGTPVNLGHKINSGSADFSPGLTPDGKYLLFSRDDGITRHIYWVSSGFIDSIRQIVAGVSKEKVNTPKEKSLLQNYPNPFNPTTTIRYLLNESSKVKMTIYNLLGQKIKTLQNAFQNAGEYSIIWDATDDKNNPVSSGVYFYWLDINEMNFKKKMVLLR